MAGISARSGARVNDWSPGTVAVLGPGAVGGTLAALVAKAGVPVTCIARPATVEILAARGIEFSSGLFGDHNVSVTAAAELDFAPDVLFIATKSVSLSSALTRIPRHYTERSLVVPVLNGLEHVELIRRTLGKVVAPAIVSFEAKYLGPGRVRHTTDYARMNIASDADIEPARLQQFAAFMTGTGIETSVLPSEADVLWGKLVRLNAMACTTAASNMLLGAILADSEWRGLLQQCVREGATVAQAYGVDVRSEEVVAMIGTFPPTLGTSMQRDVNAGRPPELDAIPLAIVRAGERRQLQCPVIERMVSMIRERMQQVPPVDNA